jgi:hypothetical protein
LSLPDAKTPPDSTAFIDGVAGAANPADSTPETADAQTDAAADLELDVSTEELFTSDAPDSASDGWKPGFNYECAPLTVESCKTVCGSTGTRKCLKEWGPCIPPAESCNNCADDDCDGLVNEDCPPKPECGAPTNPCPVANIAIAEGLQVGTGTTLHLSAAGSKAAAGGAIGKWAWSVQAPAGASGSFQPNAGVEKPTFQVDAAGDYSFQLQVWDDKGVQSCAAAIAIATVAVKPYPPVKPSAGCADGTREGFVDQAKWPQVAGCAGAWDQPGITPDAVQPTCGNGGGNSGKNASGKGCSAPDLCAPGWHVCKTWQELAQKSPTGCAGAAPDGTAPKSLFFALRQPSQNGSVCGNWGAGFNDVFGCGNLGATLAGDKKCGPLDRVLASTQPNKCGFNEAEPNLGPWECFGPGKSDLEEGKNVTKKACQGQSCQYDGKPLGPSDKGGVLCCVGE